MFSHALGYMFSRVWHWLQAFRGIARTFPALGSGCMFFRPWHRLWPQLHVLLRMFSRVWHRLQFSRAWHRLQFSRARPWIHVFALILIGS